MHTLTNNSSSTNIHHGSKGLRRVGKKSGALAMMLLSVGFFCGGLTGVGLAAGAMQPGVNQEEPKTLEVKQQEMKAWFDRAWERAKELPDFGDRQIIWKYTQMPLSFEPMNEEQADQMSSAPQSKREPGPTVSERYVLARSKDAWRFGMTWQSPGSQTDVVNTADATWVLFADSLKILDPSMRNGNDPEHGVSNHIRTFRIELGDHTTGGMELGDLSKVIPFGFESLDGRAWSVQAERIGKDGKPTFAVEYLGEWLAELGRGRVLSKRVVLNRGVASHEGTITKYTDHRYDEGLGLDVAWKVETFNPQGRLMTQSVVVAIKDLPEGGFKLATSVPTDSDPIRGKLEGVAVYDLKRMVHTDGKTGAQADIVLDKPPVVEEDRRAMYRMIGYSILVVCTIVLVVLKSLRRKVV